MNPICPACDNITMCCHLVGKFNVYYTPDGYVSVFYRDKDHPMYYDRLIGIRWVVLDSEERIEKLLVLAC